MNRMHAHLRAAAGHSHVLVYVVGSAERANGVGHIIGAVCKAHCTGRDDLQHLECLLGARVKLLGRVVHLLAVSGMPESNKQSVNTVKAMNGHDED